MAELTVAEITAELRAKAHRLRAEMSQPIDIPPEIQTILAIAFIEEVNARYDRERETATGRSRKVLDLAVEICKARHNKMPGDQTHRDVTYAFAAPAPVHVLKEETLATPVQRYVPALQMMLGGARPLWAHYILEADSTLGLRGE